MKRELVILTGPTAVGKTELSVQLAKKINGEIISADSIQVYKYMDIGSAKITKEEMQGITHYMIDELEPTEEFNVYLFQKKCLKYMEKIYQKEKTPIIVGGTGFYIQSVLYDIDFTETVQENKIRERLELQAKEKGTEFLYEQLKKVDLNSALQIHKNNVKRVIRALEYYEQTGKKFSEHNEEQRTHESPYCFKYFVLNDKRELLYQRINQRVEKMIKDGLEKEVRALLQMGCKLDMTSMQGIGYKEMAEGIINQTPISETIEKIKLNTRHFAKRQLTWFRREKNVTFVDYQDFHHDKQKMLDFMVDSWNQKKENNI